MMPQQDMIEKPADESAPVRRRNRLRGRPLFSDEIWEPFARLRGEVDRMYEDFTHRPFGANVTRRLQALSGPALELKDNDNEYELVAEIPGMKAEDIEVKVAEGVLRLSGERSEEKEGKENGFLFSERHYGHFERAIQLPDGIDNEQITADADNGLLTVHLPKTEDSRASEKVIPVQAS